MKFQPRAILASLAPFAAAAVFCVGVVVLGGFEESFADNFDAMVYDLRQHVVLVLLALVPAVIAGLALGVLLSRPKLRRGAESVMQLLNVANTVPSLAVIALSMNLLGIGMPPVVFALWLVSLLPIARNTYTGLRVVPPELMETATGLGMRPAEILWRVELPNAAPAMLAGLRIAVTVAIGTAPLAFLIGGGGLGELIFSGIAVYDIGTIVSGAVPIVLLAMLADVLIQLLGGLLISRGLSR